MDTDTYHQALSALHLKYDGPIPAEEMAKLLPETPYQRMERERLERVARRRQLLANIAHERRNIREVLTERRVWKRKRARYAAEAAETVGRDHQHAVWNVQNCDRHIAKAENALRFGIRFLKDQRRHLAKLTPAKRQRAVAREAAE